MKKCGVLILLCLFLVGCSNKAITVNEFLDAATFNGYVTKESKEGYESYSQITRVNYAINRENAYVIQFLELNDEEYAHKFFLLNRDEIRMNVNSYDYEKSKSTSNYELYHAETISEYFLVIRSNKNIIYVNAPIGYINEIEEFLSDLSLEY